MNVKKQRLKERQKYPAHLTLLLKNMTLAPWHIMSIPENSAFVTCCK